MCPQRPTPGLGAALRTPQTLSVMPRLTEAFPEPWTAGPGLQSSLRAAPGLTPSRDTLLRTAVAHPPWGLRLLRALELLRAKYLNPWLRAQLPVGWSCTPWRARTQPHQGLEHPTSCGCPSLCSGHSAHQSAHQVMGQSFS